MIAAIYARKSTGPAIVALFALLALAGCQSMADVTPGDGKAATITGKTYDQVWAASVKVADEHFEIWKQDKAAGTITAERTVTMWGWGSWVGIYITPAASGAPNYRVEVVSRKKQKGNLGEQGWEGKTLRDIQDVLDGRPMR
jgi:hypothetical protein